MNCLFMGSKTIYINLKGQSAVYEAVQVFVYIRNVIVIYIHGILYTIYYSRHGHSMRLWCIFQLPFP